MQRLTTAPHVCLSQIQNFSKISKTKTFYFVDLKHLDSKYRRVYTEGKKLKETSFSHRKIIPIAFSRERN